MYNIQKEIKGQGPLLTNEEPLGEKNRTVIERLNRVLQLVVNLDKKMSLNRNMSGVAQFIKESKQFISDGKYVENECQITERPGMSIVFRLTPDKTQKCVMLVKINNDNPVCLDLSDYYSD